MAFEIKQPRKQEKKESFEIPSEEKEEKSEDLFSMKSNEEEHINELNADLYSEQSPIKIKNKSVLLIEANGKTHEISKDDIVEYHRKYRLDGIDGYDIQGFRNLGTIKGDYESLDKIYKDSKSIFNRIDENSGGYKTLPDDEDD